MVLKKLSYLMAALILGLSVWLVYNELFNKTASATARISSIIAEQVEQSAQSGIAATPNDNQFGLKRAQTAINEYNKNVVESIQGCNCGSEIDKYTENNPGQWCTTFASWVSWQAGSPLKDGRTGSWRFSNSRLFTEYLKLNGVFYSKDQIAAQGLKPQIGDFVVFWRGNPEANLGHIDIVVDVNQNENKAGLIGGNIRDRIAYRKDFPYLGSYGFLGFGRPEK